MKCIKASDVLGRCTPYPGYVADQLMAARDSQPTPVSITDTVSALLLVM